MHKSTLLGSIAALGFAGSALAADELSYTYVEGGYVRTDLDDDDLGIDVDGDGFGVRGSLAVNENIHVFAAFSDQDFDFNVGVQTFEVGGGVNWPLKPNMDIVGTVSYLKADLDGPFGINVEDDGFGLGAALRAFVVPRVELQGGLKYVNFDEGGDDTSVNLGGRYYFTDQFAVGAEVDINDDGMGWLLGGRFNF